MLVKRRSFKQRALAAAVASCYLGSAFANPTGGTVAAGSATFSANGNTLTITNTPGAIINWQQFSIQKDEVTRFLQQNAASAVLNRVTSQNPSVILGSLLSNGRVFLINPNGIAFGQGAMINVAGLAASTLNISDADFTAGRMRFVGTGSEGAVTNAGTITTPEGGHVYLIAPNVRNEATGVITSPKGEVVIAAGRTVELVNAQTPDIRVEYTAPANEAVNAGQIVAASGRIGVYGTLIKNSGLISATGATVDAGGKILFRAVQDVTLDPGSRVEANGSQGGAVTIQAESGTLLAQGTIEAKGEDQKGGQIQLLGKQVALDGTASVNASGNAGGGSILIGGDARGANPDVQNADAVYLGADTTVRADAGSSGDGGSVIIYSKDSTKIYGAVSARGSSTGNGGSVETSGHYLEVTQAPDVGSGGSWLIDPYNIEIVAGNGTTNNTGTPDFTPNGDSSQIGATLISGQLNSGTSVTVDTGGFGSPGTQQGNIAVNGAITSGPTSNPVVTLSLRANNDISINAPISMAQGFLDLRAGNNTTVSSIAASGGISINSVGTLALVANPGGIANVSSQNGQTIIAGALDVRSQGGSAALNNNFGDQNITVNNSLAGGGLSVQTLTPGGTASIFNGSGTQTITLNAGDLNINSGFGNAVIQANGTQNVSVAGNIRLANSTTGVNNSFAGILGANQTITGTDVTLTAGFATGTTQGVRIGGLSANPPTNFPGSSTNLTLNARNVTLNGGSGAVNGSALGTSASVAMNNNIVLNVAGRVQMNSGADGGTRIGSGANALAGGNISISAGIIEMNGTTQPNAIRTTGNVTLSAGAIGGSITQGANGSIRAGSLTSTSNGSTSLLGTNQISSIANATSNGGDITINNSGPLSVTTISAPGSVTLNNSGALSVAASGTQDAKISAGTGQSITAQSLSVTAQDGRNASISTGGTQTISINGGNLDIIASGGSASVSTTLVPGVSQVVTVTNGDRINVNGSGAGSNASLNAIGGSQTISITGTGANAITVGSSGALGTSGVNAASQSITAGTGTQAGSIGVTGADTVGNSSFISAQTAPTGAQSIATSGAINVLGGNASGQLSARQSGIFNNGAGQQTVNAASISLQGGSSGSNNGGQLANNGSGLQSVSAGSIAVRGGSSGSSNNGSLNSNGLQTIQASSITLQGGLGGNANGAFINANGTGAAQHVTANSISLNGGQVGAGNVALLRTINADQTIDGNPIISVNGGASGGSANNGNAAAIQANGVGRTQTITAGSISVAAGATGTDNSATITGNTQSITVAGGVTLNGGGSGGSLTGARIGGAGGPTSTNLTLTAGADVVLTGGSQTNSGARFGSGVATTPVDSNVTVNVTGGKLVLNEGTGAGAAIGYSLLSVPGGGTIKVTAQSIEMNGTTLGTQIRTTGNVELHTDQPGGTITQSSASRVLANGLTTTSNGSTDLNGQNQVSSYNGKSTNAGITLNNTGALAVTGLQAATSSSITNNGAMIINGALNTGAGALNLTTLGAGSVLNQLGGSIQAGSLVISSTGATSLIGSNVVSSFNGTTTGGDLTFNNTGALNLATNITGNATVTNAGNVTVTGNATATGNQTIAITGGSLDVLGTTSNANLSSGGSQTISVSNGDHINVNGAGLNGNATISANNGTQTLSITGSGNNKITVGTGDAAGSSGIFARTQNVTAGAAGSTELGSITITGGTTNGRLASFQTTQSSGSQGVSTTGEIKVTGGSASAQTLTSGIFHLGSGTQTISADTITLNGGASGNGNGAQISSQVGTSGAQTVTASNITLKGGTGTSGNVALLRTVNADQTIKGFAGKPDPVITVTGGDSGGVAGNGNSASISAGGAGHTQKIDAASLTLTSGAGGTDAFAGAFGNTQNITVVGDVRVSGSGSQGSGLNGVSGGSRIGSSGTLATNLTLKAGGDIVLTGGSGNLAAARLGAGANATPVDSNVTVNAGGNVVLNGGTGTGAGAAIGYSSLSVPGGGTIGVTAANGIQLNGNSTTAEIRTTGNVTLNAQTISQSASGAVLANGLTTTSNGSTDLSGQNQVSSYNGKSTNAGITLNNTGSLTVTGLQAATSSSITNNGAMIINGALNTGAGALNLTTLGAGSVLNQLGGSIQAGSLITSSTGATSLGGPNQVSSFNGTTTGGDLTFNNGQSLEVTGLNVAGNVTVTTPTNLTLSGVESSTGSQFYSAASISQLGFSDQIIANGLTTTAILDTRLLGDNRVASFNGTMAPGGNLSLHNSGPLDITGLDVSAGATILNAGDVTISGLVTGGLTLSGAAISEGAGGRVVGALSTTSSGNTTLLGANQISSFNGTSTGGLSLNNSGALDINGLSVAGNASVVNAGELAISGFASVGGSLALNATAITETTAFGTGQIFAGALTTSSVGATSLSGFNSIASFNGTTLAGDVTLNNFGALDVTALNVAGNATINNSGSPVTISGLAASTGIQTVLASSVSEGPAGRIVAGGLTVQAMGGGINLGGANQVSTLNGSSLMTGDDVTFNNSGALTITGLSSSANLTVTNAGAITVTGSVFAPGSVSFTSTGAGSDLTLKGGVITALGPDPFGPPTFFGTSFGSGGAMTLNSAGNIAINSATTPSGATTFGVNSGGPMTVNAAGSMSIAASGSQSVVVSSNGGSQTINAQSLSVSAQDGRLALITNSSPGTQSISVTGGSGIDITATGPGSNAQIFSNGPVQTVSATNSDVSVRSNGQFAGIFTAGSQKVSVTGGSIDVVATSGSASISSTGLSQSVTVTNGDHITVMGAGAGASGAISAGNGIQNISITGTGANAITVGTTTASTPPSALGNSSVVALTQSIKAGDAGQSGSITILGSDANNTSSFISTNGSATGTQTISTSGAIKLTGGKASNQAGNRQSGIFHAGQGKQTIDAASMAINGGPSGNGNGVIIGSNTAGAAVGGEQVITVNGGSIDLKGGGIGVNNRASITVVNANQTINGNPAITITGGDSGGVANSGNSSNAAFIVDNTTSGAPVRTQTINAGSMALTGGAGGTENFAAIGAAKQVITSVGNVTLTGGNSDGVFTGTRIGGQGGGAAPTATDLTLTTTAGDVILTGGSQANAGARLGSTSFLGIPSAPPLALDSKVTINAAGNVILNEGSAQGAAIGYAGLSTALPAGGDIKVTAGKSIQMNGAVNGTAIRTTGNVELHADQPSGTITQSAASRVVANGLTTTSRGSTDLSGQNQVSTYNGTSTNGAITLNNLGTLNLAGLFAATSATLIAPSVNGAGNVFTGTGFNISVASDSLLSGVISGAGGLNKNGGGTLTVSGDNTYSGDTNVLAGTLALGGTDRANSGVVNISSGATYRGSAGSFTNSGIIAGNGTLDVAATSFTNAGTLRPGGTGAIGTLTVAGNATLASSSLIDIEAQSAASHDVLAITGAAALNGNLNVTPINGYAPANGDTLTPLTYASRSGTVFVPGTWLPTYNPGSLSLGFDSNINRWVGTTGNWNVAGNWSRGHTPLASETVLVDVPGAQLVSVSDGSRFAGKLVSFEDFTISGGSLSLGGPSFFNGGLALSGGTLQGAGNVLATTSFAWTGGTLGGTGQFTTAPGSIVTLSPTATSLQLQRNWVNQGFVTWQGANGSDLVIADGNSLVNMLGGVVTLAAVQGSNIKGGGAFRNDGTVNMNGAERTTIKTSFVNGTTGTLNVNSGTLRLKDSAANEGSVAIANGATLEVKGGDYANNGRISGSGTLDVDGHLFRNVGVLAPGGSNGLGLGTFTIRGDYYQAASGVLEMGLGGILAGQYDVLAVTGKASLGGTLATNAVYGYVPGLGDSFNLLTYKSRTGQFTTLEAPGALGLAADYEKRFARFTLD
jgi:hypothetical protein